MPEKERKTSEDARSLQLSIGDCLGNEFREVPHIFFRRIKRAHPADDGFVFVPNIEEVSILNSWNSVAGNLGEHTVGFDVIVDLDLWDLA